MSLHGHQIDAARTRCSQDGACGLLI
jgi:hypothetical protein